MKRNEEVIYHILGCLERKPDLQSMHASELKTGKISLAEVTYHLALLNDSDLIIGYSSEFDSGQTSREAIIDSVSRLTMAGHDYLDLIRKTKQAQSLSKSP